MKWYPVKLAHVLIALLCIVGIATYMAGCSEFSAPTASQNATDSQPDLWNPQPGDQIVSGREVPLLEEGYWESLFGPQVNPAQSGASSVIGPEGGVLYLGFHQLIIPPGAVSEDTRFRMNFASNSGVAVDCNPSPFTFNVPVTLVLSFAGTQYENADIFNLQIFYMPEDGDLVPVPSVTDDEANTVTAELDHFSRYILG